MIGRKIEERDDVLPVSPPALCDRRIFAAPGAGVEILQRLAARSASPARQVALSSAAIGLRSFHEAKSMELRMRWIMQVWTIVGGNTAAIASGNPFRPSTTAIKMSSTPRFLSVADPRVKPEDKL